MNIVYCVNVLKPQGGWTAGADYGSIVMLDGSAPPTVDELQKVWVQREADLASAAAVKAKLAAVLATFNAGQLVAYAPAVQAVSDSLDDANTAKAKDIITTFPAVDETLRGQLLACF